MSLFAVRWYLDQGLPDDEIAIKLGVTVAHVKRQKRALAKEEARKPARDRLAPNPKSP